MDFLLTIYFLLLAAIVAGLMAYEYLVGKKDLLCIRNFFLLGFIVFQLTSATIPLITQDTRPYMLRDLTGTAAMYAVWSTIFVVVFLLTSAKGWVARPLARWMPTTHVIPSVPMMLVLAFVLTAAAVVLHQVVVYVPLIGVVGDYFAIAFAAIACGLVGWVWAPRLMNPLVVAIVCVIVLANAANVVTGSFGRRQLIAVAGGLVWGMYYSHWRYLPVRKIIGPITAVAAVPVIALALYTSVRSSKEHDRSATEHVQAMKSQGDVKSGLIMLLDGQGTALKSMWLMENHPENFEHRHLFIIRYAVIFPIPRSVWADKPDPLSTKIANMAMRRQVNRDRLTIGPGIVGHAAAEGGFYALIVYAVLMGMIVRFLDELVLKNPYTPFVVLPVGCALGQVLGMPRGETSVFMFILLFSVVGSYLVMQILVKMIGSSGMVRAEASAADAAGWGGASPSYAAWDGHAADEEAHVYGEEYGESSGDQGYAQPQGRPDSA